MYKPGARSKRRLTHYVKSIEFSDNTKESIPLIKVIHGKSILPGHAIYEQFNSCQGVVFGKKWGVLLDIVENNPPPRRGGRRSLHNDPFVHTRKAIIEPETRASTDNKKVAGKIEAARKSDREEIHKLKTQLVTLRKLGKDKNDEDAMVLQKMQSQIDSLISARKIVDETGNPFQNIEDPIGARHSSEIEQPRHSNHRSRDGRRKRYERDADDYRQRPQRRHRRGRSDERRHHRNRQRSPDERDNHRRTRRGGTVVIMMMTECTGVMIDEATTVAPTTMMRASTSGSLYRIRSALTATTTRLIDTTMTEQQLRGTGY